MQRSKSAILTIQFYDCLLLFLQTFQAWQKRFPDKPDGKHLISGPNTICRFLELGTLTSAGTPSQTISVDAFSIPCAQKSQYSCSFLYPQLQPAFLSG